MSTPLRANSFSRKAFKNTVLHKQKSEADVVSSRKQPQQPPLPAEPEQPTPASSVHRSASVKSMSRVLSSRKHSVSITGEALTAVSPEQGPNRSSIAKPRDRAISVARSRNVSFLQEEDEEEMEGVGGSSSSTIPTFKKNNRLSVSTASGATSAARTASPDKNHVGPSPRNKNISMAIKSRRYSTHLVDPNSEPASGPGPSAAQSLQAADFVSFDFSMAESTVGHGANDSRNIPGRNSFILLADGSKKYRSGSIVMPDGTKSSSFASR